MLPKTKHIKTINEGIWLIKLLVLALTIYIVHLVVERDVLDVLELVEGSLSGVAYLLMVNICKDI